jgi:hypothetical protein
MQVVSGTTGCATTTTAAEAVIYRGTEKGTLTSSGELAIVDDL